LVIQNVDNFTMKGIGGFSIGLENLHESSSRIECKDTHMSGFIFINVSQVQIQNLTFASCGQHVFHDNGIRAALVFYIAHNVTFSRVTVRNTSGFGLHADRVSGNVQVYESAFFVQHWKQGVLWSLPIIPLISIHTCSHGLYIGNRGPQLGAWYI